MTPTRDDQETPRPESLPWVERLVGIDTTSRGSNLELIDVVAAELRARGLQPEIFPDDTGTKANLVVTVPAADGTRTGGVVLSAHTDVVPVDGQAWSSEPFTAEVRDGRLYGRGTADMKGFLGVALHLLPRMLEASLSEPIHLALSYDEEVGCVGGAELVKQLAGLELAPRACLVGEPTSLRVIRAHKSVNLVRVTFTGVAAHSSLTSSGVNAIEYGARFITAVRALADEWRADGPFDEGFEVAHTTIGVNVVEGGIAANTVPDRCVLTLDFRSIAADDPDDIVERLRGFAADVERDMKAEHEDATVEVEVLAMVPGLDAAPDDPAAQLAVELGATRSDEKVTYGTEAGQFAGTGIPTVVCGPGDIAQAHKADEFVDLDQLVACEQFIGRLIDSLSG